MSDSYLGEIRAVGFNFAPQGWATCNGSLLPISDNEALFNLLGTTYGGDGQNTFGLPNMQGRTPIHQGSLSGNGTNFTVGEYGGAENVTVNANQLPAHVHPILANGNLGGGASSPSGAYFGVSTENQYAATPTGATPQLLQTSGGGQLHANLQPYLAVYYIIAVTGIFPSQN